MDPRTDLSPSGDGTGRVPRGPRRGDGEARATADVEPAYGDVCDWGDCYGERVDRFLAWAANLDGERPSTVTARGYYGDVWGDWREE